MKIYFENLLKAGPAFSIIAICACFIFLPPVIKNHEQNTITLSTESDEYFRFEFIKINIKIKNFAIKMRFFKEGIPLLVKSGEAPVTTIGNTGVFSAKYDEVSESWKYLWPCPWNASPGKYELCMESETLESLEAAGINVKKAGFKIKRRDLPDMEKGWSVLTFENNTGLDELRITSPEGVLGGWKNIFKWANFINADSFLYLASQTAYFISELDEDFPWTKYNLKQMSRAGKEAHKNGLEFGAYVMAYLTLGKKEFAPDYEYAIDYDYAKDELYATRAISLNDEKRVRDLTEIIKRLGDMSYVDFVGIDYIRNALGGYELVEDFVAEMYVSVPEDWGEYSSESRMKWLARKKVRRRDMVLIDKWQWWRAHKSAAIVERVKKDANLKKPLWVFTLSWDKGWQHGQDPVMMADAGADFDGVMLYEANRTEFNSLIADWNSYLKKAQANILIGDVIDWPLHQRTLIPSGPAEYLNRSKVGVDKIYGDGICSGIFIHDLTRGLAGRKGPYSTKEWMLSAAASISYLKQRHDLLPIKLSIDTGKRKKCLIKIENTAPEEITAATLTIYANPDILIKYPLTSEISFKDEAQLKIKIPYRSKGRAFERANNSFIAVRVEYEFKGELESTTVIEYFKKLKNGEYPLVAGKKNRKSQRGMDAGRKYYEPGIIDVLKSGASIYYKINPDTAHPVNGKENVEEHYVTEKVSSVFRGGVEIKDSGKIPGFPEFQELQESKGAGQDSLIPDFPGVTTPATSYMEKPSEEPVLNNNTTTYIETDNNGIITEQ